MAINRVLHDDIQQHKLITSEVFVSYKSIYIMHMLVRNHIDLTCNDSLFVLCLVVMFNLCFTIFIFGLIWFPV